jgi:hypothetical protein
LREIFEFVVGRKSDAFGLRKVGKVKSKQESIDVNVWYIPC